MAGRGYTFLWICLGWISVWMLGGCGNPNQVRVRLQAAPPLESNLNKMQIRAEVSGPQTGLSYKWFADGGECTPQQTDYPSTTYKFAGDGTRDRIVGEVWKDNKRVAIGQIEVSREARAVHSPRSPPSVEIEITQIPPYNARGGPYTQGEIGGRVTGEVGSGQKVLIYARASDLWYAQPSAYSMHTIRPDHTWSSVTHTGSHYAAFVVHEEFTPVPLLDVLPEVGGDIFARVIVIGKREPPRPSTNDPTSKADGASTADEKVEGSAVGGEKPPSIIRVVAGLKKPFTDGHGNVWLPGKGFEDGVVADRDIKTEVENTDTPALYRAERYDLTRFSWKLPNGDYVVKLHFAEMFAKIKKPGDRVFSFNVEGHAFDDFDILEKAGGARRAYIETVPVEVKNRELTILFYPKVQYTVINAIEIIPRSMANP